MGRPTAAVATNLVPDAEDDFDPSSQVAILRRAVAEVEIPADSPRGLASAARELSRLAHLAEAILSAMAESAPYEDDGEALTGAYAEALLAVAEARKRLDRLHGPRIPRTRLESVRRKLHAGLAELGEALAVSEIRSGESPRGTDLDRALRVRHLVSDFYGCIPWEDADGASRAWALLVANAELKILLKYMAPAGPADAPRQKLIALGERISGWKAAKSSASSTSQLYTELVGVSSVLASLSARPEVKHHDSRALLELTALLSNRSFDDCMTERLVDVLSALRGMDPALDRLITALPLDPSAVLAPLLGRVTELRTRSAAS